MNVFVTVIVKQSYSLHSYSSLFGCCISHRFLLQGFSSLHWRSSVQESLFRSTWSQTYGLLLFLICLLSSPTSSNIRLVEIINIFFFRITLSYQSEIIACVIPFFFSIKRMPKTSRKMWVVFRWNKGTEQDL